MGLFPAGFSINDYVVLREEETVRVGQVIESGRSLKDGLILLDERVKVKWLADGSVTSHGASKLRRVGKSMLEALLIEAEGVQPPKDPEDWLPD